MNELGTKLRERASLDDTEALAQKWTGELQGRGESIYILQGDERIIPITVQKVSSFLIKGEQLGSGFPVSFGSKCILPLLADGANITSLCKGVPVPTSPIGASVSGGSLSVVRISSKTVTQNVSVAIAHARTHSTSQVIKVPIVIQATADTVSRHTKSLSAAPLGPVKALAIGDLANAGSGKLSDASQATTVRQMALSTTGTGAAPAPPPALPPASVEDSFTALFKGKPLSPQGQKDVLGWLQATILDTPLEKGTQNTLDLMCIRKMLGHPLGDSLGIPMDAMLLKELAARLPPIPSEEIGKEYSESTRKAIDGAFKAWTWEKIQQGIGDDIGPVWSKILVANYVSGPIIRLDLSKGSEYDPGPFTIILNPLDKIPGGQSIPEILFHELGHWYGDENEIAHSKVTPPSLTNGLKDRGLFTFATMLEEFFADRVGQRGSLSQAIENQSKNYASVMRTLFRLMPEAQSLTDAGLWHLVETLGKRYPYFSPGLSPDVRPDGYYSARFANELKEARQIKGNPLPGSVLDFIPKGNPNSILTMGVGYAGHLTFTLDDSLRLTNEAGKYLERAQTASGPESVAAWNRTRAVELAKIAAERLGIWINRSGFGFGCLGYTISEAGGYQGVLGDYRSDVAFDSSTAAIDHMRGRISAHRDVAESAYRQVAAIIEKFGTSEDLSQLARLTADSATARLSMAEASHSLGDVGKAALHNESARLSSSPVVRAALKGLPPKAPIATSYYKPGALAGVVAGMNPELKEQFDQIRKEFWGDFALSTSDLDRQAAVETANQKFFKLVAAPSAVSAAKLANAADWLPLIGNALAEHSQEYAQITSEYVKQRDAASTPEERFVIESEYNYRMSQLLSSGVNKALGITAGCIVSAKVLGNRLVLTLIGDAMVTLPGAAATVLLGDAALGAAISGTLSTAVAALGGAAEVGGALAAAVGIYLTIEQLCHKETWDNLGYLASHFPETLGAASVLLIDGVGLLFTETGAFLDLLVSGDIIDGIRAFVNGSIYKTWVSHMLATGEVPEVRIGKFVADAQRFGAGGAPSDDNTSPSSGVSNGTNPGSNSGGTSGGNTSGENSGGTGTGSGGGQGTTNPGSNSGGTSGGNTSGGNSGGTGTGSGGGQGTTNPGGTSGGNSGGNTTGGTSPWVNPNSAPVRLPSGQVINAPVIDLSGIQSGSSGPRGSFIIDIPRYVGVENPPTDVPNHPPAKSVTLTGVWWHGEDGSPTWIPQEKMDSVAKETLNALYKVTYEAKWGVDVTVSYVSGPQSMLSANPTVYLLNLGLDSTGQLIGDSTATLPGTYPVDDGNVAADPPASSGGKTGAVPVANAKAIRGVPLSQQLKGSNP